MSVVDQGLAARLAATGEEGCAASLLAFQVYDAIVEIPGTLHQFARVAQARGDHARSARLLGAAEGLRASMGMQAPTDGDDLAAALQALGSEGFAAAYLAGQRMDAEEAISYTLGSE